MEQIKSYWKQFAAWVTGLKHDPFVRSRLKPSLFAILIVAVFLFTINWAFSYYAGRKIDRILRQNVTHEQKIETIIDVTQNEINATKTKIQLACLPFIIVAIYYLMGSSLKPIRRMVESQKRFISDVAHELRTPLSIIKMSSDVALMDKNIPQEELIRTVKSNREEVDRMASIIQNLINLSRTQNRSDEHEIALSKIDLSSVINRSIRMVENSAHQKGIEILTFVKCSRMIWGNSTSLEQVTLNLLKNAISFTPTGGLITVSIVDKGPKKIELTVRDTGGGISKKDLPHVFEPFYRADHSRQRHGTQNGSGLGLTIVKKIIEQHNGSIDIKSTPGKGTSVIIDFYALAG